MSARNMRAAAHAPCSQRALSMFTAQILNSRLVSRCSRIGGAHRVTCTTLWWRRWRWLVDEGRSLSMMSHVFVLFTDLYNQWLRFVHSITINDRWLNFYFIRTVYCGCSEATMTYHGTPTAFLTNFTKTVKLTKTPIACHFWRWNSFSCDYFIKSWKLLESGFPDRYFGRSMLDCKPYCEQSSHMYCIALHM